jgi:transcriptional regulator with XRE-family HTH domain
MSKSLHSAEYSEFRELLVRLREESSKTQTEIADVLGLPQSFVSKYETGERRLDVIEFINVCNALGAEPSKVFKSVLKAVQA